METPFSWKCPYCGHPSTITAPNYIQATRPLDTDRSVCGHTFLNYYAVTCPNPDCRQLEFRAELAQRIITNNGWVRGKTLFKWQLLPDSLAKPQPDYIPENVRKTYYEACKISKLSPQASATLSRRCLQGMIRDFWQVPQGKRGNLAAEINFIKDRLDEETWQAIDDVRSIGNIGAHMEKDVDLIVDVEPDEAELLIELIELLFEEWYARRQKRLDSTQRLRQVAAAKQDLRKGSSAAAKAPDEDNPSTK